MSEQPPRPSLDPAWNAALENVHCPHCDWHYLIPEDAPPSQCPHCFRADLEQTDGLDEEPLPYTQPPELLLPFNVDMATIDQHIETFAEKIPFAPKDLDAKTLRTRIRKCYWPMWIVDGDVNATWDAEVGFDYQVVSHRERYGEEGWDTEETRETRSRWEPRAGTLKRHYDNIIAPALDEHTLLIHALGRYPTGDAQPYAAAEITGTPVRLPDRAPEAAWTDAVPGFQQAAMEECRQAARADRIQSFRWAPTYAHLHWTLLLLPAYTTYYFDDEQHPQVILINGQTGKVSGARRASLKRAQQTAIIIGIVASVLFVLGLGLGLVGLLVPPLIVVGIVIAVLAFIGGMIGSLSAILMAARFNRRQPAENIRHGA